MSLTFGQAIAQAIADAIKADGTFSAMGLEPRRRYAARWLKLDDSDRGTIHVDVCQGEESTELVSRSQKRETIEIQLAVRKLFGPADREQTSDTGEVLTDAIDEVAAVQSAIRSWFNSMVSHWAIDVSGLTGLTAAVGHMTGKIKSSYVPQHLLTLGQYTGILTVEFQGVVSC